MLSILDIYLTEAGHFTVFMVDNRCEMFWRVSYATGIGDNSNLNCIGDQSYVIHEMIVCYMYWQ